MFRVNDKVIIVDDYNYIITKNGSIGIIIRFDEFGDPVVLFQKVTGWVGIKKERYEYVISIKDIRLFSRYDFIALNAKNEPEDSNGN